MTNFHYQKYNAFMRLDVSIDLQLGPTNGGIVLTKFRGSICAKSNPKDRSCGRNGKTERNEEQYVNAVYTATSVEIVRYNMVKNQLIFYMAFQN